MKLHAESLLPYPRGRVFATYRDRLVELVPFLPNVRRIEVKSRSDEGDVSRIVNVWHGGGEIPSVARAVVSDKMLSWDDHATWDGAAWTCAWRMDSHALGAALRAEGLNRFEETPDGNTRLVIDGILEIDGKKLPIPRFLAGTVGPAVEKFLVERIKPNLTETARGVERFLAAH